MSKSTPFIRYTSRDFDSIKTDLINYAKKYYPNTYQDFNKSSFGSLMLDTVSYVGDIMSFYLDYQANESFLDTAVEYDNILKLGAGMGFRPKTAISAVGTVTLYVPIPANEYGTDYNREYFPTIKKGTTFSSTNGNRFTLLEDVIITPDNAEIRKSRINEFAPFSYVAKVYGKVISGVENSITINVGEFVKFRKELVGDNKITEIISVVDSEGNNYYEVDYLTQNVIYKQFPNITDDKNETPYILKPVSVVRRYSVIREQNSTYIQFGGAADGDTVYKNNKKLDPSNLVITRYGKDYTTDESFDPTLLVETDSLGLGPSNTTITVTYRRNELDISSIPVASINTVLNANVKFPNPNALFASTMAAIVSSISVVNEEPIVGQYDEFTSDELKTKIYGTMGAQNRAVTQEDYKALCYNMPGKFGSIKRVSIQRDLNENKRNLNLYVISENSLGQLIKTNNSTKRNLKTWINKSKIINDTIDIVDALIVNYGIYFTAVADSNMNKYDVLTNALTKLKTETIIKLDIGESLKYSTVYEILRRVDGILDVRSVEFVAKNKIENPSADYSQYSFDFKARITPDEMFLKVPKNVIMEIKYPDIDIEGKIV